MAGCTTCFAEAGTLPDGERMDRRRRGRQPIPLRTSSAPARSRSAAGGAIHSSARAVSLICGHVGGRIRSAARLARTAFFGLFVVVRITGAPVCRADGIGDPGRALPHADAQSDAIFSQYVRSNQRREKLLQGYSSVRRYEVKNVKGRVLAQAVVLMDYQAPGTKTFQVRSSSGSALMRTGLKRAMAWEAKAAKPRVHQETAIEPLNYTLSLLGEEPVEAYECWALSMVPKRKTDYLFRGKLWITKEDLGTLKIMGQPARSPSFWIKHLDFVRHYQRVGEFWLPVRDEVNMDIRLLGKRILTIDYRDYRINGGS